MNSYYDVCLISTDINLSSNLLHNTMCTILVVVNTSWKVAHSVHQFTGVLVCDEVNWKVSHKTWSSVVNTDVGSQQVEPVLGEDYTSIVVGLPTVSNTVSKWELYVNKLARSEWCYQRSSP